MKNIVYSNSRLGTLCKRIVLPLLALCFTIQAGAQTTQISGTVTDANGPMSGVSVTVKGTTIGTMTGTSGTYSISAAANATLVFSFMGYATQEQSVGGRTSINVTMSESTENLDEVVVVGYGTQKKSDVTGAVASVSDRQLQDHPVANALEALQGKAAGVDITNNYRPGEIGSIRIRGERSITGGNDPLYVLDGIPLQGNENIAMLNTNDIKSIEILKDASATAIYGSRGANGVVLISTYGGRGDGKFSVRYSGSLTISELVDSREHFNAAEWIDLQRWARYYSDPNTYPRGDQPTMENDARILTSDQWAWKNIQRGWASGTWDGSKVETTDWASYVTQTGVRQNHTISVSGGTDKISAYTSFGYLDDGGTTQGQSYKRWSLNNTTNIKPVKWFEMGANVQATWQEQQYGQDATGFVGSASGTTSLYASAMQLYPYAVPFDSIGNRLITPGNVDDKVRTVVDETKYSHNLRQTLSLFTNIHAQVNLPLDGLRFRTEFGPSFRYRRRGTFVDPESTIRNMSVDPTNAASLLDQRDFSWTINNLLLYNKRFGLHDIGATLLQTASYNQQVDQSTSGENIPVGTSLWNNMGAVDRSMDFGFGSSLSEESMTSYMARLNYGFNDRYLLTVSGRWDGASVLADGHKWAFFPSASLAWRIDQENFMKAVPTISQLKLRLGYGVVGNAAIGRYTTLGSIFQYNYPYGTEVQAIYTLNELLIPGSSANPAMQNLLLTWEKTSQFNIGANFGLFKSRISGEIDFYTSTTNDLLLRTELPSVNGFTYTNANVGITKNHGVDIMLNTVNIKNLGGFSWVTNLTASYQKNEIVELSAGKEDMIGSDASTYLIGKPIAIWYNYQADGLWRPEDAEEMAKFNSDKDANGNPKTPMKFKVGQTRIVDQNGDYVIDLNHDRVDLGSRTPTWTGAMTNTFAWKGIELSISMYGRMGYMTNGANVNMSAKFMVDRKVDYYTENNTGAAFQRPDYEGSGTEKDPYAGILGYEKASFINIRNISLGYVFPQSLIRKWGNMQELKVYVQVLNPGALYQSCNWKNMDLNSSIWTRSVVFGLNIGF